MKFFSACSHALIFRNLLIKDGDVTDKTNRIYLVTCRTCLHKWIQMGD